MHPGPCTVYFHVNHNLQSSELLALTHNSLGYKHLPLIRTGVNLKMQNAVLQTRILSFVERSCQAHLVEEANRFEADIFKFKFL